jgi:hypothetical protein
MFDDPELTIYLTKKMNLKDNAMLKSIVRIITIPLGDIVIRQMNKDIIYNAIQRFNEYIDREPDRYAMQKKIYDDKIKFMNEIYKKIQNVDEHDIDDYRENFNIIYNDYLEKLKQLKIYYNSAEFRQYLRIKNQRQKRKSRDDIQLINDVNEKINIMRDGIKKSYEMYLKLIDMYMNFMKKHYDIFNVLNWEDITPQFYTELNKSHRQLPTTRLIYIDEKTLTELKSVDKFKNMESINKKIKEVNDQIFEFQKLIYNLIKQGKPKPLQEPVKREFTNDDKKQMLKDLIQLFRFATVDIMPYKLSQVVVEYIIDPINYTAKFDETDNYESLSDVFNAMMKKFESAYYPDETSKDDILNDIRGNIISTYMNICELTVNGLKNMIDEYIKHYMENKRFIEIYNLLPV